jgi:hypothetical protein
MLTLPADHQPDQRLIVENRDDPARDLQLEVDGLARSLRAGFTMVLLLAAVIGLLVAAPFLPHPVFIAVGGVTLCGLLSGPMTGRWR